MQQRTGAGLEPRLLHSGPMVRSLPSELPGHMSCYVIIAIEEDRFKYGPSLGPTLSKARLNLSSQLWLMHLFHPHSRTQRSNEGLGMVLKDIWS